MSRSSRYIQGGILQNKKEKINLLIHLLPSAQTVENSPASKNPDRTRHKTIILQSLTNPCPIVTTPQEKAIELNQIAGPTLLRTRLLGSSKIIYYPSSILVSQFFVPKLRRERNQKFLTGMKNTIRIMEYRFPI